MADSIYAQLRAFIDGGPMPVVDPRMFDPERLRPKLGLVAEMEATWRELQRYGDDSFYPTMAILPGRYFRRVRTQRVGRWIVKGRWRVREDALQELRCMGYDGALREVSFNEMYLLNPIDTHNQPSNNPPGF